MLSRDEYEYVGQCRHCNREIWEGDGEYYEFFSMMNNCHETYCSECADLLRDQIQYEKYEYEDEEITDEEAEILLEEYKEIA